MAELFDIALEKRFSEADEIAIVNVTAADTLLIKDTESGAIMRMPFSTLTDAIKAAFGTSFAALVDGKVPAAQLPSYVDDVLEYANLAGFPNPGESGKIYIAIDTRKTFRWSGSAYIEVSPSDVNSVAGKTGIVTLTKSDVGLANVDNTSDVNKPVSSLQSNAIGLKANAALENWHVPLFMNSWANLGNPYNLASYYKDNFGIVHLAGLINSGVMQQTAFVLPAGYRPSNTEVFVTASNNAMGSVFIGSDGSVKPYDGSNNWFSLDGITFRSA